MNRETIELYLHPEQKTNRRINGYDIDKHLEETGLIDRCLTYVDIQPWISYPETFPEDLKGKTIFLWKSPQNRGSRRRVMCIEWHNGQVSLCWRLLVQNFDNNDYVALTA